MSFRMEMSMGEPHSPIDNPWLTEEAKDRGLAGLIEDVIKEVLARGRLSPHEKMLQTEAVLLSLWKYSGDWKRYLDSPLIAHADAALVLGKYYDAAVAVKEAGIPYGDIFRIMGFPVFDIDFSHHRRNMERPEMDEEKIRELQGRKNVLLIDIDFVTGKTLGEVVGYLREKGINAAAAYTGLSRWPGIESDAPHIGTDTVDFENFWGGKTTGLNHLRSKIPYKKGIVHDDLKLYSPNPGLPDSEMRGSAAARRVAQCLKERI